MTVKKLIGHPVMAAIVAAAILSIIATLIPHGWNSVASFLVYNISIPVWLILLLGIISCLFAKFISYVSLGPRRPEHCAYVSDEIKGIEWHWSWPVSVESLIPMCPKHKSRLFDDDSYAHDGAWRDTLRCDHCDAPLFEGDGSALQLRVLREIERRVNTGEWKGIVARKDKCNSSAVCNV